MNESFMRRAIELARQGEGLTAPNPMVGCVVVKNNTIVADGWHERYGGYHAERNALLSCKDDVHGATMYVTLEPCCHTGKTPPCTDIIIERGIRKVVIGSGDPNPLVAGGGVQALRAAGIEVETGIMKDECDAVNEVFFHYITKHTPFVVMKYAMTLDGKIATTTGDSKWISSEASREHVHVLRKKYRAILVGIGTVLADDPLLNYRGRTMKTSDLDDLVQPIRIILDSHLRIPVESRVVSTASKQTTVVVCCENSEESEEFKKKKELLIASGVTIWELPKEKDGQISIRSLLEKMGSEEIDSVLVEGGAAIHGSFLSSGHINRIYAYIAPKLVGGDGLTPISGTGIPYMKDALTLNNIELLRFGNDICVNGRIQ